MKNYIILLVLLMAACGGNSDESNEKEKSKTEDQTSQQADSSKVEKVEEPDVNENNADQNEETALSDCVVDFEAYISDPSGSATNVRKTPGGEVITEIVPDVDHTVHIIGVKGQWLKIDFIDPLYPDVDGNTLVYDIPGQFGWIHFSVLGLGTRNYGGQSIQFYEKPSQKSVVLFTINKEFYGNPVNACGNYIKLEGEYEGKKVSGWIKKEWLCTNPLTNCS